MANSDEACMATLMRLMERLRADMVELGEKLEVKQRKLRLAEATMELLKRRQAEAAASQAEGPEGGDVMRAEGEESELHASQASVRNQRAP
jgi:hypothetical protein